MRTWKKVLIPLLMSAMTQANAFSNVTNSINLMTYNIACLPKPLGIQINGSFLRANEERTQAIINVINQLNQGTHVQSVPVPNIIAFEEAFDPTVRNLLKQQLSARYPYNSGTIGEKALNAGSGLLLFSQYPILETEFHPYTNIMAGDEWLANKGYIIVKLKYDNQSFMTVIITHLSSGDAIDADTQSKEATTSFRRGEQMARIYAAIQTKASDAPKGYENLKYLKTFVLGDLNAPLNNEREQKSISTGMSNNGYKQGQVKYPGQYWLFSILKNTIPSNFADVRIWAKKKGDHEPVDPALLQAAIQQNKFTGSTIPQDLLKTNLSNANSVISRQSTEYDVIDGLFTSLDGVTGDLETQLVSLNEMSPYKYEMSDHLTLMGKFTFTQP